MADTRAGGAASSVDYDPFAGGDVVRSVPSTEPQRELWLAAALAQGRDGDSSLAYNESIELRLTGALDVGALRAALRGLVERHEALRSTFSADGMTMNVTAAPALDAPLADLSALDPAARAARLEAARRAQVEQTFDLGHGPLFRAELARLAADDHVLFLTSHHIVCDGWSAGVLVTDLAALYAAARGEPRPLAPAERFSDYALAERAREASPAATADERYWIERFAGALPAPLDLPTDRQRPAARTTASDRVDHELDADLAKAVKRVGAQQGGSLFVTLLSAFAGVLNRLTGQTDVVIGIPAAGQAAEGHAALVGHCVNMLPLRIAIDAGATFGALIKTVRTAVLDGTEHQGMTFGTLLRKLPLPRDPSRLPLVNVIFNAEAALAPDAAPFPGLTFSAGAVPRRHENFELFINAVEHPRGIRIECQFNRDLYDGSTVRRWLAEIETLLRAAVAAAPGTPLGHLDVLGDGERARLAAFNRTAADTDPRRLVHDLITAQARATPDRVAVTAGDGRAMSYADLDAHADVLARRLRAAGVGPGQLVGLATERGPHMLVGLLGVLRAGAGYVPLDPAFPDDRIAFMVEDAGLRLCVTEAALAARFGGGAATLLLLDGGNGDAAAGDAPPPAAATPDDVAYVIYTSGSTGKPKGVRVPHRAVVNLLESVRREPGMTAADVVLAVTTLSFDIAVSELILPLVVGARIVLAGRADAGDGDRLRALVERERVTFIDATPATWRILLAAGWRGGGAAVTAICTGEAMPRDLAAALLPLVGALWNGYGPTETTVWSSFHHVTSAAGPILIGRPAANTQFHVLGPDGRQAPIGAVGEIYIGGAGVTLGYLARPELTAERFVPDPFAGAGATMYRTGDLGRWRADGTLECLGRTDHQVKLRGYRIELGEIEATLATHAGVRQAVAIAREDRPGDVRLAAYVIAAGDAPSAEALRAHLQRTLPEYMIPAHFVTLAALPLLPNGKIDRRALPAPLPAAAAAAQAFVAPTTDTEHQVAAVFQELLAVARVGVDDSFFLLGGHSLLAAQAAARLGRAFGRVIPMRVLFEAPTVARLAAWIDGGTPADRKPPAVIPRRADQSRAPLSLMQQRVWFLEQLQPGRVVYNVPSTHRLRGRLDEAAFARAFAELLRRQTSLRTAIAIEDGMPIQKLLPDVDVALFPPEDLSAIADDAREAALRARLLADIARPFTLTEGPLFRAKVYKLGPEEHAFFFMVHHIVWDGWSFDLLYGEMAALYGAFAAGQPSPLPPLPVTYGDFAAWQRDFMQGAELDRQLAHWQRHLAGALEPLALPTERPRPAEATEGGGIEWLRVPLADADAIRALGRAGDATSFMALLAVYYVLLHRLSGQRDVVVGTPVRARNLPEIEDVMGFFVNALPLRLTIDPAAPFTELLASVRAVVLDAFTAEDVPFEHLVRALKVPRDRGRSPIFQTFFSYQDVRGRSLDWGDLRHDRIPVSQPGLAQDLSLWFVERPDGLLGGLNYATDLFGAETARLINGRYLTLLRAILADPRRPIADLPIVPRQELDRVAGWNATAAEYPRGQRIEALTAAQAARAPDRTAIVCGGASMSYRELDARANRMARCLRRRGVGRGTLVGVALERSSDMVAAVLAVLKAGGAYVPLDPGYPSGRLGLMVEDSKMRALIAPSATAAALGLAAEATLAPDEDAAEIMGESGDPPPPLPDAPDAEDAAYVIYTSGSTGKPKGVRVPHRGVVNFVASMKDRPGMTGDDRLLAVTTLSFDIAALELLLPLTVGASIVLASRDEAMDGVALRGLLESTRATIMQATPATWRLLIEAGWRGGPTFRALCGGEPLPPDLAEALLARAGAVWNMYGPTETTVWSTCWRVEAPRDGIWIGTPIGNTQVWILDDRMRPCPIGVPGEIFIGGDGVALGYLDRPALTAERFVPDPFAGGGRRLYRTGDLGRWRVDGQLECLGRTDFQVKVRGHRIELGEIEAALIAHPTVVNAVVAAGTGPDGDKQLVAYVVGRDGDVATSSDLRRHLRGSLPEYMIPPVYVTLDAFPLTPNGKVDRRALPDPAAAGGDDAPVADFAPPATAMEQALALVWQETLKIARVGVGDNFFDLGGHSLLVMRVIAEMERRTGRRVGPREFIFATLEQVAQAYDDAGEPAAPPPAGKPPAGGLMKGLLSRLFKP